MKIAILLFFVSILAACGGGGDGEIEVDPYLERAERLCAPYELLGYNTISDEQVGVVRVQSVCRTDGPAVIVVLEEKVPV